jgi:hypothetical protein
MEVFVSANSTQLQAANGARFTVHRQSLYDTQIRTSVTVANSSYRFFGDVQNKPLHITNLRQNAQLEKGNSFQCHGIVFAATNMDDLKPTMLHYLQRNSGIAFTISDKIYYESALGMASGKIYQDAAKAGATDTSITLQSFGAPDARGVAFGKNPWNIDSQQGFAVNLSTSGLVGAEIVAATPTAAFDLYLRCELKGLYTRPIQ